jgi:ABC-type multidrug transport system ATPase subunit
MLKEGSYACYWNRIYLVGPFGVGKTTLAKNLVGDAIPEMWASTDGIWIYMGRAGMDTEQRKWVFLDKGKFIILIKELSCCWKKPEYPERSTGKQLVNFITCSCESSAPFFVIYKAGRAPTPYW